MLKCHVKKIATLRDCYSCVCSGSANCGSFGIRIFKFDILSNDVILANKVENWTSLFLLFN
jgi:hypothetical protein